MAANRRLSKFSSEGMVQRFTFLCHELVPIGGGAASALDAITKVLARRGRSIQIVTAGLCNVTTQETDPLGREIVRFGVGRKRQLCPTTWNLLRSYFALRFRATEKVRAFRPNLLVAYCAFPAGRAALALRKELGVPLMVSLRGSDVPGFCDERWGAARCVQRMLVGPVWKSADALLANGTHLVHLAHRFEPAPKARNWPNGIDTDCYCPPPIRLTNEPLRILFVGQLIERKRCKEALEAVKWLGAQGIPAQLTIVGDGPERSGLVALASRVPDHIQVNFKGYLYRAELPAVYRQHDVLLHLSSAEGVSNVLMEAMASGLAVICTRSAAEHVYASQRHAAVFVHSIDPVGVGRELMQLAKDTTKRRNVQRRARQLAQRFDWEHAADDLERYAREVSQLTTTAPEHDDKVQQRNLVA